MADNKLNEIISTALEKMQGISDGNTVIGKPIETPSGTTIIPVSRVSLGLVSGGVDYFGKNQANTQKSSAGNNFGGGGATGVSIVPVSFLIISPSGSVDVVSASAPPVPSDPVSRVVDLVEGAPELIEKIRALFPKKEKSGESGNEG
ncbi:MAG: sporulation protein YtfJ [Clostridia bacterium]|nr:sporulation protein YtfJ [Clostridia bacterium]